MELISRGSLAFGFKMRATRPIVVVRNLCFRPLRQHQEPMPTSMKPRMQRDPTWISWSGGKRIVRRVLDCPTKIARLGCFAPSFACLAKHLTKLSALCRRSTGIVREEVLKKLRRHPIFGRLPIQRCLLPTHIGQCLLCAQTVNRSQNLKPTLGFVLCEVNQTLSHTQNALNVGLFCGGIQIRKKELKDRRNGGHAKATDLVIRMTGCRLIESQHGG